MHINSLLWAGVKVSLQKESQGQTGIHKEIQNSGTKINLYCSDGKAKVVRNKAKLSNQI